MALTMLKKSAVLPRAASRRSMAVRASGAPSGEPKKPVTLSEIPASERVFTDGQWNDAIKNASAPAGTPVAPPAAAPSMSFGDAMAFSGPAPETINGRLAMLGFVAAVGAELATGQPVLGQFQAAAGPILAASALFAVASFVPLFKGANPKEAFGPFSPAAELINGRAAMIGFAAILAIEFVRGSALL